MKENLRRFLRGGLLALAWVACVAVFLLNLRYLARVGYDWYEKLIPRLVFPGSLFYPAMVLLLALLLSRLDKRLERLEPRKLFFLLAAVYTLAALYLIFNVDSMLRSDQEFVHHAAGAFLSGDYSDFEKGGYLYQYPNQLGLTLYEAILALFSPNPRWNMLVNFLMVLGINYTVLGISRELFHHRGIVLLTVLCSFAFLPQFFFILFVYGTIPGFFCMISGFYHTLRFAREGKRRNLIALVLFCAGAAVLKSNYAIGVLAIGIYLFLQMLKGKGIRKLAAALAAVLLCLVLPGKLVTGYFEAKTGADLSQGAPEILWVAMGTNIDNWARTAGWYDATNSRLYRQVDYDRQAAAELGVEMIKENLEKICQRPGEALRFLVYKTMSQWCDPLYESIWSGPGEKMGQHIDTRLLQSLYGDGLAEHVVLVLCKIVSMLIWMGAIVFLLCRGKQTEGWELFFMYFLGGLIFHTFWEGKSQYIYPYVFCLIPCAMSGFWELSRKMKGLFSKKA